MTEIDKINEDLRNYKLFKIQRINAREQQFSALKKELTTIKKNEVISYLLAAGNILCIIVLIYSIIKSLLNKLYFDVNYQLICLLKYRT